MKIVSWNVNGWRAINRKGAWQMVVEDIDADFWFIQEIKTQTPELEAVTAANYDLVFNAAEKKGYSGTMILIKHELIEKMETEQENVFSQFYSSKEDEKDWSLLRAEGRTCGAFWKEKKLLLLNIYFPNGGMSENRLDYKMFFYQTLKKQVNKLRSTGIKIVIGGDVNTAHEEIDLARPKQNSKITGFLPMEREWITDFLKTGWIDTFRELHPEEKEAYSWWDYKTKARERNVGWRIDYFFITDDLLEKLKSADISNVIQGSDHAPISIEIKI